MSNRLLGVLHRVNSEGGQALAEYSLVLAFIAVACVLALGALGLAVAGHIDNFAAALP